MLSLDAVKQAMEENLVGYNRKSCGFIDRRDYSRIMNFLSVDEWEKFGFGLREGATPPKIKEWAKPVILQQLKNDLDFAFEKAIHHRGISSSLLYEVILMWMWVLEDELATFNVYEPYGIPLYKKVARKYNLPDRSEEYFDED